MWASVTVLSLGDQQKKWVVSAIYDGRILHEHLQLANVASLGRAYLTFTVVARSGLWLGEIFLWRHIRH